METELDKRQELIEKINNLSAPEDVQKVRIFIAGMEMGKAANGIAVESDMKKAEAY